MITSTQAMVLFLRHHLAVLAALLITSHAETLVYPRLLESRADDGALVLHIREGLTLNLRKSSILAKDFVVASFTTAGSESVLLDGSELERDLYQDTEHLSSLLVSRRQNGVEVRGTLNSELRITPVLTAQRSDEDLIPHNIFNVEERSATPLNASHTRPETKCAPHEETSLERADQRDPAEFIVEVCVAVDPKYAKAFNKTQDLVTYLAASLNAVALWFTDMVDPFIGFQFNSIIMTEEGDTAGRNICGLASYVLSPQNACAVDIIDELYATINMTNSCRFPKCDLTLKLSSEDMGAMIDDLYINRNIRGVASLGGVCTNHSVAVAEDEPNLYTGVSTIAHEIAHALGASHDGENRTLGIEGYPQASQCSWSEGYLMSFGGVGENMHKLSECSKAQIQFVVRTLSESCIQVSTKANYSNHFYPGQNMTFEEFCQNMHPEYDDVEPANHSVDGYEQCKVRCCWNSSIVIPEGQDDASGGLTDYLGDDYDDYSDDYVYTNPKECKEHVMPEAMPCGQNKTCWRGVCDEHNWTEIYNTYHTYRTFETMQLI